MALPSRAIPCLPEKVSTWSRRMPVKPSQPFSKPFGMPSRTVARPTTVMNCSAQGDRMKKSPNDHKNTFFVKFAA
jgi:hypothetical protein